MTHLVFGTFWSAVAALLLLTQQQANLPWGQSGGMLAAFAGMLAGYNFLRFAVQRMIRRLPRYVEPSADWPRCPKCGRRMKLIDLGPGMQTEKDRWKLSCCGYQLQIDDDEERRRILKLRQS